jgi:hypothetical protein
MKYSYYIKSAPAGSNSYHVMCRGKFNDDGEEWCEDSFLTHESAAKLCQRLNESGLARNTLYKVWLDADHVFTVHFERKDTQRVYHPNVKSRQRLQRVLNTLAKTGEIARTTYTFMAHNIGIEYILLDRDRT